MRELQIQLRCVEDVRDFVALATARSFPIYVENSNHQVNGTSFMEMFSLNLCKPMVVTFQCSDDEYQKLCLDASRFAVM